MVCASGAIATAIAGLAALLVTGCGSSSWPSPPTDPAAGETMATEPAKAAATDDAAAIVTAVETTAQSDEGYTFAVTIQSPDTGCDRYANWWEVIAADGELLYRRILAHSHVDEQPFERSGGPVAIAPDRTVIVRAHLYPDGYGTQAMQGNPTEGFQATSLPDDFAADLAGAAPQPENCAF